jgi:hypothetical protein
MCSCPWRPWPRSSGVSLLCGQVNAAPLGCLLTMYARALPGGAARTRRCVGRPCSAEPLSALLPTRPLYAQEHRRIPWWSLDMRCRLLSCHWPWPLVARKGRPRRLPVGRVGDEQLGLINGGGPSVPSHVKMRSVGCLSPSIWLDGRVPEASASELHSAANAWRLMDRVVFGRAHPCFYLIVWF